VAQQDPASPSSPPVGESADESVSELPAPREAETLGRPRLPGQRPQSGDADEAGPAEADSAEIEPIETEPAEIYPTQTEPAEAGPPGSREASGAPALGARERAVLDFERRRWKHTGAKEQAIRDEFELSATRYYQILNALLDDPAALAYSPALVGRLRRIREARGRARR
jgi:hypothetical protein